MSAALYNLLYVYAWLLTVGRIVTICLEIFTYSKGSQTLHGSVHCRVRIPSSKRERRNNHASRTLRQGQSESATGRTAATGRNAISSICQLAFLRGRRSLISCYDFPKAQCEREHCQYVHWAEGMEILPGQADWADIGTENGTIPSLNFKSCGIGQLGDDSASNITDSRR